MGKRTFPQNCIIIGNWQWWRWRWRWRWWWWWWWWWGWWRWWWQVRDSMCETYPTVWWIWRRSWTRNAIFVSWLSFLTTWTLESLMGDTMKHRAAVVAEGRRQVREHLPFVLLARLGTRNRGPEKSGPSFVVCSCVYVCAAERSRRTAASAPIDTPKGRIQLREKKTLSPFSRCFLFPLSTFFPRGLAAVSIEKLRWRQKQQGRIRARGDHHVVIERSG